MKLTKRLKIGNNDYSFQFEGTDLWECLMEAQKVSLWDLPQCGKCGSELLRLVAYKTKEGGYKYIKVTCGKCKAQLTLGQSKQDNAYYYRRNDDKQLDWVTMEQKDTTQNIAWED